MKMSIITRFWFLGFGFVYVTLTGWIDLFTLQQLLIALLQQYHLFKHRTAIYASRFSFPTTPKIPQQRLAMHKKKDFR
jgi:hypothetical protein